MDDPEFSFYIDGVFAATFEEEHLPRSDGRYRYMPYRGAGHYDLCRTIDTFGFARCFYADGPDLVYFTARDAEEYGVLDLSEFERVPKQVDGYEL